MASFFKYNFFTLSCILIVSTCTDCILLVSNKKILYDVIDKNKYKRKYKFKYICKLHENV